MARSQTQFGGLLDTISSTGLVRTGGIYGPLTIMYLIILTTGICSRLNTIIRSRHIPRVDFIYLYGSLFILLAAFLPQSHELRYYVASFMLLSTLSLIQLKSIGQMTMAKITVLLFLAISLTCNFTQPVYTTVKEGLSYATNYSIRDLPSEQECNAISSASGTAFKFSCLLAKQRSSP